MWAYVRAHMDVSTCMYALAQTTYNYIHTYIRIADQQEMIVREKS